MQQQERRRVLRSGLAMEDFGTGDRGAVEAGRNGIDSVGGRHGENSCGKGNGGKAAAGKGHWEGCNLCKLK